VIEVVRLGPDDWARYRTLRLAALASDPDAFGSQLHEEADQPEAFWRQRVAHRAVDTLLAHEAGDDLGLVVVAPAWDGGDDGAIYSLWVKPEGRGRGVGDALMAAAEAAAVRRGLVTLRLEVGSHNHAAQRLYERAGYRPTGRTSTMPPPREHIEELELALSLPRAP